MASFRLDREPWIPCIDLAGQQIEVSLIELFRQSSKIRKLTGNPLEIAAITRFCLALVHLTENPQDLKQWKQLWDNREQFKDQIIEYIRQNDQYWDLYCERLPFLQDHRLIAYAETNTHIDPEFIDVSRKGCDPHVDHSQYIRDLKIPSPIAVRALLSFHLFSPGGTCSPNPLIQLPNNSFDKYSSNSIAAQACVGFLEAGNLCDTLLLNLVAGHSLGTPGWQWPKVVSREPTAATGLADFYTRPTRAVCLLPSSDGKHTVGVFATNGTPFLSDDAFQDPMIPLDSQSKNKLVTFQFKAARALWRSAHALLLAENTMLGVVRHLAKIKLRFDLDVEPVSLRVLGISGKTGRVKHHFWRDESLPFSVDIFSDNDFAAVLGRSIYHAEKMAEKTTRRIKEFTKKFLHQDSESASDPKNVSSLVNELALDLMDFWSAIAPAGERIACDDFDELKWKELLDEAATKCFEKAVERLPPSARRYRAQFKPNEGKNNTRTKKSTAKKTAKRKGSNA